MCLVNKQTTNSPIQRMRALKPTCSGTKSATKPINQRDVHSKARIQHHHTQQQQQQQQQQPTTMMLMTNQ
jgi:hypothetical protein